MDVLTIANTPPRHKPLHRECTLRVLRYTLVAALYLAHEAQLPGLEHRLSVMVDDCDRILGALDLA